MAGTGHQRLWVSWMMSGSSVGLILGMINGMSNEHTMIMVLICGLMGGMFGHRYAVALRRNDHRKIYADLKAGVPDEIIHAFTCMEKAVDIRTRNQALLMRFQDFQLKVGLISGTNGSGLLHIALQAMETELHQSQAELQRASMLEASARQIMVGVYDDIEQAYILTL